jgi:DNA end-binding protein Ku
MARGIWNGALSFGLVNVPVSLMSSVRDLGVHFTQLHERDGAPIDTRRFCSKEDKEVPYEQIVAGYEVKKGKWVTLTDEDFEAVEPRKTRTIDIEAFVPVEDVDPIYFDHPYFLVPTGGEGAARAYRLLVRVMKDSDRLALGRFVLRTKEYLAAIHVRDEALALTTMLFHDEVRPTKGIQTASAKEHAPTKKQVDHAVALIEELTTDFKPSRYKDRHRERLLDIIDRKRKGRTIEAPEPQEEPEPVPDLMAALEESLASARKKSRSNGGGRSRSKSRAGSGGGKKKSRAKAKS